MSHTPSVVTAFQIASASSVEAPAGRAGLFGQTFARKRSKSSLLLNGEQSTSSDPGQVAAAELRPGSSAAGPAAMLPGDRPRSGGALLLAAGGGSRAAAVRIGGIAVDYALDWLLVLAAIIVLAFSEKATPRDSYVTKAALADTSYPLLPNSVPAWSVPVYTLLLPMVLFGLHGIVLRRPGLEGHHLVLGLLSSVLVTAALTNCIKAPVGRLRPDFNARCWPDGVVMWRNEDALGGWPRCSGNPDSVAEGRKSFPSGHSSWSASGLCYLMWWLFDRLGVFDGSGHPWRLMAAILPGLGALAVAVSRVADYWHHASDVAAGLALGALLSWLFYRQQRCRLAELDPGLYGSSGGGGGGGSSSAGFVKLEDADAAERLALGQV